MEQLTIEHVILSFAFLLNVGLGLLVFLKKASHKRVNIFFAIFSWASASWILSVLMFFLFKDPGWRLFCARMTFVSSSIICEAFFFFSILFPREKRQIKRSQFICLSLISLSFVTLSFTPLMVPSIN